MPSECGGGAELQLFDPHNEWHRTVVAHLYTFSTYYATVHNHLAVFICLLGSIANTFHIVVLTRPAMKRSTVNRLLAYMALMDILTMQSYLVYIVRFGLAVDRSEPPQGYSYGWVTFLMLHVVLSIGLHTASLYTSVWTAFIRYQAICKINSRLLDAALARYIIAGVLLFVAVLSVPTFLVHEIIPIANDEGEPTGLYTIGLPALNESCILFTLNLWLTGVFFKVIPCVFLIVLTVLLVHRLHANSRQHAKIVSVDAAKNRQASSDRTTLMLIIMLAVFLVTEFPQGLLSILNGIFPNDIHQYVYANVGEVLDMLSLVNGNVCFICYPLLSTHYRQTASELLTSLRSKGGDGMRTALRSIHVYQATSDSENLLMEHSLG